MSRNIALIRLPPPQYTSSQTCQIFPEIYNQVSKLAANDLGVTRIVEISARLYYLLHQSSRGRTLRVLPLPFPPAIAPADSQPKGKTPRAITLKDPSLPWLGLQHVNAHKHAHLLERTLVLGATQNTFSVYPPPLLPPH